MLNDIYKTSTWQLRSCIGLLIVVLLLGCQTGTDIAVTSSPKPDPLLAEDPELTDAETANLCQLTPQQVRKIRQYWGITNKNIAEMPQKILAKSLRKIYKPKKAIWSDTDGKKYGYPDKAAAWRRESLINENGIIPDKAWVNAIAHVNKMPAPANRRIWGQSGAAALRQGAGIDRDSWTWLGPGNIGGRSRSLVIDPDDPDEMLIGSVAGGIWRTVDGGDNWEVVDDFMSNLAVCAMVMDPTNSSIIYAGTGEGFFNADAIRGGGVFKSIDGGITWKHLTATSSSDWYYVNRLAINQNGILLAATGEGLFRSTDGGGSWSKVLSGRYLDVKFDPNSTDKAICSKQNFSAGTSEAAYSVDGGVTWTASSFDVATSGGRIELAYAGATADTLYALVDLVSGTVYKSTDGGVNFQRVYHYQGDGSGTYAILGAQGWYDNTLWVDPTNANLVVAGGIDLYRSTDGAGSFAKISTWQYTVDYGSPHADHHFIVNHPDFDGSRNMTVFVCNDGGIYKTENIYTANADKENNGWQELNNNLGITQFYGAAGNSTTGTVVGGTQDNGSLQYTTSGGAEAWREWQSGDGGYCAFDPNDSNYCYGEYVYLKLYRSTRAGEPAGSDADNEMICGISGYNNGWIWKDAPYYIPDAKAFPPQGEFIAPFILDPNETNRLLIGGLSLWRTDDVKTANTDTSGPSWSSIKAATGTSRSDNITAIAVAKGNSDIVWVGHRNGNVYKTANGTAVAPTWERVDNNTTALPERRCQRITIDPNNSDTVYVCFGGFSSINVYKSTDGGSSWAASAGVGDTALPAAPVRSLVIYPENSNWIYVGTEVGIFASEDGGASWSTTNEGPTNCSVDELFWMDNVLMAATHGRGIFSISVDGGSTTEPSIAVEPSSLNPKSTRGVNAEADTFMVYNSGVQTLNYTISDDANAGGVDWISCSPTSGDSTGTDDKDTITVTYSTSNLETGTYSAKITVADNKASNSPKVIPVTLTVENAENTPEITLTETSIKSTGNVGQTVPAATFAVANGGTGTLNFAITDDADHNGFDWLTVSPASGTSSGSTDARTITLNYDSTSLVAGTYNATLTVSDSNASNSPRTLAVTLTLSEATETMTVSESAFKVSSRTGVNAPDNTFSITNQGSGILAYTITDDVSWLSCSPTEGELSLSGQNTVLIDVAYETAALTAGTYQGVITIAGNAANSPVTIAVTLQVRDSGAYEVTSGSQFQISADQIEGVKVFLKKPKVYIIAGNKKKTIKVLNKPAEFKTGLTEISCEWHKTVQVGRYDLYILPKDPEVNYKAILVSNDFQIKPPGIDQENTVVTVAEEKETRKGVVYDLNVKIPGLFFGNRKPKVYLEYKDANGRLKKKNFKVSSLSMDVRTGNSSCTAVGKRIPANTSGTLYLVNPMGVDTYSLTVNGQATTR